MSTHHTDNRIEKIREKYKNRLCIWCDKLKKDCDDECECIQCCFPDKVYSWEEYPNINEWIRRNVHFFNELFEEGLVREDHLDRNWHHTQLPVLQSIGTEIKDWSAFDLETDGGEKLIPNSPEDFTIITPYSDFFPNRKRNDGYKHHCELCGQGYNTRYFIKNINEKKCIAIGGDCGYAFHFSDQVANDIKSNMLVIIRKMFHKDRKSVQKRIEKRLVSHPKEKWLLPISKRLLNYDTGSVYISPENLAKLLLKLEKNGIKVFDDEIDKSKIKPIIKKSKIPREDKINEKKSENTIAEKDIKVSSLIKDYVMLILETIKKLRGPSGYAVNKNQIIQELEKHGMSEIEIEEYIKRMMERNEIFEFTPNTYKILE